MTLISSFTEENTEIEVWDYLFASKGNHNTVGGNVYRSVITAMSVIESLPLSGTKFHLNTLVSLQPQDKLIIQPTGFNIFAQIKKFIK